MFGSVHSNGRFDVCVQATQIKQRTPNTRVNENMQCGELREEKVVMYHTG